MGLDICHVKLSIKTDETIDFLTVEEFKDEPDFLKRYENFITTIGEEIESPTKVIYYVEKGYQRKNINKDFINKFENDKLYFDINSVRLASTFLHAREGESQSELEQNFKNNFIDNFVEGESIFFISW
jgi:hypothetical protein